MTTRTIVSVITIVAAVVAGCGSPVVGSGVPVDSVGQVQRSHFEEDDPQWNCLLDGDGRCSHVPACWTEHKRDLPDERLCGFADGAGPLSDGFVFGDFMRDPRVR